MARFAFFAFCYRLLFFFFFFCFALSSFFRFSSAINSLLFASVVSAVVECVCFFFVFAYFLLPRYFFHSRVIAACPATTDCIDCIVSQCENNNKQTNTPSQVLHCCRIHTGGSLLSSKRISSRLIPAICHVCMSFFCPQPKSIF